ncbi:MAG: PAS domain S-box protein, partial [Candidatus Electrothrix sp. ATG2]|nr:PAS domain S-box protein [Candidatus Electrothrix sp. ATG2]
MTEKNSKNEEVEKLLLEKQEFFSVVEEISKIGNFEWDVSTNEVIWSEGHCRIYGVIPEDFDGKLETALDFIHPDDRDRVNKEIATMIATKRSYLFEHRIIRTDGEVRLIQGNNKFYYNKEGNLTKIIGTSVDITDRRRQEEELKKHREHLEELVKARTEELRKEVEERKQAEKAAEAANRAKSIFLANMSHELRT